MARRRDDDVVAQRLALADGLTVDQTVGDDRRDIVAGIGATVGGNGGEIGVIFLHQLEQVDLRVAGADAQPRARRQRCRTRHHVGIGGAEDLLRHPQHPRLVGDRQAKDAHDDAQRVHQRDLGDEVAFAAERRHMIDMLPGDSGDGRFERLEVLRQEPAVGQLAQRHVLRVVEIDQGAEQVRVAADAERPVFDLGGREIGALAVGKAVVGLAHRDDIGVARNGPERAEPGGLSPVDGIVDAQPREHVVDALVGDAPGIDEGIVDPVARIAGESRSRHAQAAGAAGAGAAGCASAARA